MTAVARLKITLDDVKPRVLRRIDVPLTLRLDRLHMVLQAALGWTDAHLWEIRAGDIGWGPQDEEDFGDGPLDARKARLIDVIGDIGIETLHYLYDFGDGWDHTIKIERLLDPAPNINYPVLLEAKGRCPPEDVGGPLGYAEFLKAIADPHHARHDEFMQWHSSDFDPYDLDIEAISIELQALAKRWRSRSRVKRSRPS